jgi:methylenetetrahydrofolate dehydrogenase (NADP+)/methenyltetrahydrofolate cyclohydrolase
MTATRIEGKAVAGALKARVKDAAAALKAAHGITVGLGVILVGEDPASEVYVRNKGIAAREAGLHAVEIKLPASASEAEVLAEVARLNADPTIHGFLVQFPTPPQVRQTAVIDAIDPAKDVDGLTATNAGLLVSAREGLVSCTPSGALMMIKQVRADLAGLDAVVIGRSILVGRPMAQLLLNESCTVTTAHSRTRDLPALCRRADILVAAIGRPNFVRGDWVKPGAIVIDVGINRIPADGGKTRLVGDVAFVEAAEIAGAITPVPGGVGPMTIACLLRNAVIAACRQNGLAVPAEL